MEYEASSGTGDPPVLGVGESPTSDQLKVKKVHNSYWKVILKIPQTGHLEVSQNWDTPSHHPFIHRILYHKPPILGYPPFQETPIHQPHPIQLLKPCLLWTYWRKPERNHDAKWRAIPSFSSSSGDVFTIILPSFYHYIV